MTMIVIASSSFGNQSDIETKLNELIEQNQQLMELANRQQEQIQSLRSRLDQMAKSDEVQSRAIESIQQREPALPAIGSSSRSSLADRIHISGAAGFTFFSGQSENEYPNDEFLVDNIRVNLDAEITNGIYLTTQWEPYRREGKDPDTVVSEFFLDFENPFGLESYRLVNLRFGRFQTPFGEEYLHRYTMENPLVTHSIADLWGIDEGVQVFGSTDNLSYTVALQNGSRPTQRDLDSDKSLTARVGYNVGENVYLSASWMNTGDFDVSSGELSEIWIGNVVFQPIGSSLTQKYWIEMAQLDFSLSWNGGQATGSYGQANYRDDDPSRDNSRDFQFYNFDVRQNLTGKLYSALRYSFMDADGGYPFSGHGTRAKYFLGGISTTELQRLTLGLGYWAHEDAVIKLEYSFEDGELDNNIERGETDQLSAELGVRF